MENLSHSVVIETTYPSGIVECRVQRFRCLPLSDMDDAMTTVHSWEDSVGEAFRGESFNQKVG